MQEKESERDVTVASLEKILKQWGWKSSTQTYLTRYDDGREEIKYTSTYLGDAFRNSLSFGKNTLLIHSDSANITLTITKDIFTHVNKGDNESEALFFYDNLDHKKKNIPSVIIWKNTEAHPNSVEYLFEIERVITHIIPVYAISRKDALSKEDIGNPYKLGIQSTDEEGVNAHLAESYSNYFLS